jgi:endogenous inhibitor of DNA gyrase (YacG/DUF329 family)
MNSQSCCASIIPMHPSNPCPACQAQVTKNRRDAPHSELVVMEVKPFRGSMFGGWEETIYRCRTCEAVIEHTNDKNEFAPFWWFAQEQGSKPAVC